MTGEEISVRAMQSMLDMTVNAKIPDNLVHKLSFERFRIKFQCLERLPFNFKITVFLLWFWWYSRRHLWRLTEGANIVFILFRYDCSLSSKKKGPSWAENYRSENRNYRNKYRSSVLPAQKPQILRKFLRICQLFNILWQRPQDQRPISLVFIWQLMDQIIRFFRIYSHVKHILHSTDTSVIANSLIRILVIFQYSAGKSAH